MIYGRPHNCCNEHHIPLLARHRVAPHSNACSKQYSDKKVWSKASVKSSRALYESMNKEEKIRMEISHVARHQELDKHDILPTLKVCPAGQIRFRRSGVSCAAYAAWCSFWFRTYAVITSRCTNPTEAANFPVLHKCPLGYLSRALSWKRKNKYEEPPFNICKAHEGDIASVNSISQCTCSGWTARTIIFIPCWDATLLIHAPIRLQYSSFPNILYRYFEHHSKCQIDIPTLCALLSYSWCWFSLSFCCVSILSPRGARCRAPQSLFRAKKLSLQFWCSGLTSSSLFHIHSSRKRLSQFTPA